MKQLRISALTEAPGRRMPSVFGSFFVILLVTIMIPGNSRGQLTAKSQSVGGTPNINEIMKPFSIGDKGRETVDFEVSAPGKIEARAEWSGAAGTLSLILNGPGQSGYYARQNGKSPLSLSFKVTDGHLAKGRKWTLSVVNFGGGSAQGEVVIRVPSAAAEGGGGTGPSGKTAVKETVQRPSRKTGAIQSVDKSIKVLWPNGGETLVPGKTYTFRWESQGIDKVSLKVGDEFRGSMGALSASIGKIEWRVSRELKHTQTLYKFKVDEVNGTTSDESDARFSIIQPPVDLGCSFGGDTYRSNSKTKHTYKIAVINRGTRILKHVMVEWLLTKKGTMVMQDGAGFGEMFPNTKYELEVTIHRNSRQEPWDDYAFTFYVDPHNQQNEDEDLRDDNILIRYRR